MQRTPRKDARAFVFSGFRASFKNFERIYSGSTRFWMVSIRVLQRIREDSTSGTTGWVVDRA